MTKFFSRALGLVERIYRLDGRGMGDILETQGPIQPVHDVSREMELGSLDTGAMGFAQMGTDNVHGAGNTLTASDDPYDFIDAFVGFGRRNEYMAWLCHLSFGASAAGVLSEASLVVNVGARAGALAARDFLVGFCSTVVLNDGPNQDYHGVNRLTDVAAGVRGLGSVVVAPLPFPLFPGTLFNFESLALAAGTIRYSSLIWYGKMGTTPPGLR